MNPLEWLWFSFLLFIFIIILLGIIFWLWLNFYKFKELFNLRKSISNSEYLEKKFYESTLTEKLSFLAESLKNEVNKSGGLKIFNQKMNAILKNYEHELDIQWKWEKICNENEIFGFDFYNEAENFNEQIEFYFKNKEIPKENFNFWKEYEAIKWVSFSVQAEEDIKILESKIDEAFKDLLSKKK